MSESEMRAELERLQAENAQLKSKDKGGLTLKVSEKGGVSLDGMGRFPVTFYKEQWLRILASAPEIEAFIRENESKLKRRSRALKKGSRPQFAVRAGMRRSLPCLCATCYTLKRQDAEYFGGLREQVLERDGYACRVCGDPDPGVHHREPGKSVLHLMIALCAGCHAKVHRTKVVLTEFPPLLLVLWREQHPEGHEQTYLISTFANHRLRVCH